MVCKKCQCYYEYKGEVCLEDDKLTVKVALCPNSRAYLERVINDLTGIKIPEKGKEKEQKHKRKPIKETERQLCLFSVS
ncbi:hypothetical protein M3683_19545 [Metabacillus halosaccharovorans]|nr:hypothetical protein [Metabacillus halosaccharovorans]MCM3443061.1 hypothetical protein [Metabacillus halosaccharovorans]